VGQVDETGSRGKRSRPQEAKIGQTFDRDILKMNAPVLLETGTSGPWRKGIKQSTIVVRWSKAKFTRY